MAINHRVFSPFALDVCHSTLANMAGLLRNSMRVASLTRQCSRVAISQQRGYSEMAFTFASPSDVSVIITSVWLDQFLLPWHCRVVTTDRRCHSLTIRSLEIEHTIFRVLCSCQQVSVYLTGDVVVVNSAGKTKQSIISLRLHWWLLRNNRTKKSYTTEIWLNLYTSLFRSSNHFIHTRLGIGWNNILVKVKVHG